MYIQHVWSICVDVSTAKFENIWYRIDRDISWPNRGKRGLMILISRSFSNAYCFVQGDDTNITEQSTPVQVKEKLLYDGDTVLTSWTPYLNSFFPLSSSV